eukprot:4169599-Alexandrium_andersonii.AAC.1
MSASLVGSEMCIRDRSSSISGASGPPAWPLPPQRGKGAGAGVSPPAPVAPVSAGATLLSVLAA